jgi:hypothetical protein
MRNVRKVRNTLTHRLFQITIAALFPIAAFCLIASSTLAANKATINPSITTHLGDTQTFREGDIVSFYVSLEIDAYLVIVYQDAGGQLNVLLPNPIQPNNFFKAGWFIPIPNEHNPFQFRITAPFGQETLWVFASDKPLPTIDTHTATGDSSASIALIRNSLQKHCASNHGLFEEQSLSITTTQATVAQ